MKLKLLFTLSLWFCTVQGMNQDEYRETIPFSFQPSDKVALLCFLASNPDFLSVMELSTTMHERIALLQEALAHIESPKFEHILNKFGKSINMLKALLLLLDKRQSFEEAQKKFSIDDSTATKSIKTIIERIETPASRFRIELFNSEIARSPRDLDVHFTQRNPRYRQSRITSFSSFLDDLANFLRQMEVSIEPAFGAYQRARATGSSPSSSERVIIESFAREAAMLYRDLEIIRTTGL